MITMASTNLLTQALDVPPLAFEPEEIPGGGYCQITGQAITHGYRCLDKRICPTALSDFTGLFNGNPHGYLSDTAARMLAGKIPVRGSGKRGGSLATADWNLGSRLILADPNTGTVTAHHHLLIPRDRAEEEGRPYWSKVVRDVWSLQAGCLVLAILATDVKKRTWNLARAGVLGEHTPLLLHATEWNVSQVVYVSWPRLVLALDILEPIYAAGFSKTSIADSLYSQTKAVTAIGMAVTRQLERGLDAMRAAPEFLPALIMAQKAVEFELSSLIQTLESW